MGAGLLYLIDKLVVVFIYVNVLLPKVELASQPINKLVFAAIVVLYAVYSLNNQVRIPRRFIVYFASSLGLILGLAIIGVALGNRPEDVGDFIFSVLVLLLIPVFCALLQRATLEKYILHLVVAAALLAIYVIAFYVYFSLSPMWHPLAYVINETRYLGTSVSYPDTGLRISVVMGGWLCVAAVIVFSRVITRPSFLGLGALALFLFALFVNQTLGLWVSTIAGIALVTVSYLQFDVRRTITALILVLVAGVAGTYLLGDILGAKLPSLVQKGEQALRAIEIFSTNIAIGKGLGYRYYSSDFPSVSGTSSTILEATYPMILSSTGLVGAAVFAFIFLFYVFCFLLVRQKSRMEWLLIACYVSVLIAAIGNPYLWGGGLGLFILSMLAASMESRRSSPNAGEALANYRTA